VSGASLEASRKWGNVTPTRAKLRSGPAREPGSLGAPLWLSMIHRQRAWAMRTCTCAENRKGAVHVHRMFVY
jgi:hypothetical protein